MKIKACKLLVIIVTLLTITSAFAGCTEGNAKSQMTLQESLVPFLEALERENLSEMRLRVYAMDEGILSRPHTVDELIQRAKNDDYCNEVIIDSSDLRQYIDVLRQIRAENFEFADGLNREDISVCFVFETEKELLEIAVGGWSKESYEFNDTVIDRTVFLNGFELKLNDILYNILQTLYSLAY